MLFLQAMECFSAMIKLMDSRGLLRSLRPHLIRQRVSLHADDVIIFLSSVMLDLTMIREIMSFLRHATGLAANLNKSKAF